MYSRHRDIGRYSMQRLDYRNLNMLFCSRGIVWSSSPLASLSTLLALSCALHLSPSLDSSPMSLQELCCLLQCVHLLLLFLLSHFYDSLELLSLASLFLAFLPLCAHEWQLLCLIIVGLLGVFDTTLSISHLTIVRVKGLSIHSIWLLVWCLKICLLLSVCLFVCLKFSCQSFNLSFELCFTSFLIFKKLV